MGKLNKLSSMLDIYLLEQGAQQQIYDALSLDFLLKLAIMPDCHTGYSLPIGGVALLDNVISPAYVGYDVGCGMCCIITDQKFNFSKEERIKIFEEIKKRIPTGIAVRNNKIEYDYFKSAFNDKELNKLVNAKLEIQLGTLGGGKLIASRPLYN